MITILFIVTKFSGTLLLSWWWIVLCVLLDAMLIEMRDKRYLDGYQEGLEESEKSNKDK